MSGAPWASTPGSGTLHADGASADGTDAGASAEIVGVVIVARPAGSDALFDGADQRRRLRAGFLGQPGSVVLIGAERVSLPAVAREGLDEQTTGAVTERLRGHVGLECGDRLSGAASTDEQLRSILDGDTAKLVEPGRLRLGPELVAKLVERVAVPEREGFVERGKTVGPLRALKQQVGERCRVDSTRDGVAHAVGSDDRFTEPRPQPRDRGSQRAERDIEQIAQVLGTDGRSSRKCERREEAALAGTREVDRLTVVGDEPNRSEDPHAPVQLLRRVRPNDRRRHAVSVPRPSLRPIPDQVRPVLRAQRRRATLAARRTER